MSKSISAEFESIDFAELAASDIRTRVESVERLTIYKRRRHHGDKSGDDDAAGFRIFPYTGMTNSGIISPSGTAPLFGMVLGAYSDSGRGAADESSGSVFLTAVVGEQDSVRAASIMRSHGGLT